MCAFTLAAVHFTLPESRKPDLTVSLLPKSIIRNFAAIIKQPQFYTYAFTGAIASAGLYAYIAGSPHLFMELYKITERQYGWVFAAIAMGLIICSQLNSFLLRRYTSEQIIPVALFSKPHRHYFIYGCDVSFFRIVFNHIFYTDIFKLPGFYFS